MLSANSIKRIRNSTLRVDPGARPGWSIADRRTPPPGTAVYCTEGPAEVTKVCGKTSDGSRLLELRLLDRTAPPFYAAASNVLTAAGP